MSPTLEVGDTVAANLDSRKPRIGDITVFHPPAGADPLTPVCGASNEGGGHQLACGVPTASESRETFIKRVVAGPGDKIAIINGHVIRNGVREKDSYIAPCAGDSSCNFPVPVMVPPGEYFVLGDNRGASDDSRFWAPYVAHGSSASSCREVRTPLCPTSDDAHKQRGQFSLPYEPLLHLAQSSRLSGGRTLGAAQ